MTTFEERVALLRRTYAAFNARQIEQVLSALDPEVLWPNVQERRSIRGHAAVRDYWERQFQRIDARVEPLRFAPEDHAVVVEVRQMVRDLRTLEVVEQRLVHVYTFRGDLVAGMHVHGTLEEALRALRCGRSSQT
jgi:ketosteroid isomerase-like protein